MKDVSFLDCIPFDCTRDVGTDEPSTSSSSSSSNIAKLDRTHATFSALAGIVELVHFAVGQLFSRLEDSSLASDFQPLDLNIEDSSSSGNGEEIH